MPTKVADDAVVEKVAEEIDSIKVDGTVAYSPQAWTREGKVD